LEAALWDGAETPRSTVLVLHFIVRMLKLSADRCSMQVEVYFSLVMVTSILLPSENAAEVCTEQVADYGVPLFKWRRHRQCHRTSNI